MVEVLNEFGIILIYVSIFGFSDYIIKTFNPSPVAYYIIVLIVGLFMYIQ